MSKAKTILIFVFVMMSAVLLGGCSENSQDIAMKEINSSVYLLDQNKKKAYLVDGDRLIKLEEDVAPPPSSYKIGEKITLRKTIDENRIDLDIAVKILGDRALYKMRVQPHLPTKTNSDLTELDSNGLVILTTDDELGHEKNAEWLRNLVNKSDLANSLHIQLEDEDGFNLAGYRVLISDVSVTLVDNDGEPAGYLYEGSFRFEPEFVQFLSKIDVSWSFE